MTWMGMRRNRDLGFSHFGLAIGWLAAMPTDDAGADAPLEVGV